MRSLLRASSALLLLAASCATAVRTPDQYHAEVEAQVKERLPALRSCYVEGQQQGWVPPGARVVINLRLVTVAPQRSYSYFHYLTRTGSVAPSNIDSTRFEKCIADALGTVGVTPREDYCGRADWSFVFDPYMLQGEQQIVANP